MLKAMLYFVSNCANGGFGNIFPSELLFSLSGSNRLEPRGNFVTAEISEDLTENKK